MAALSRSAKYGKDFRAFTVTLTPEEHKDAKRRAVEHGVTISDVCRAALADESFWRKTAKAKAQGLKAKGE